MVHSSSSASLSQGFNPYVFSSVNHKEKNQPLRKSTDTEDFLDIESFVNANEHALLTLTGFFDGSKILKRLSYTVIPGNYSGDRVVLKFALADSYASYFPLLRGLFGFGKTAHVLVDTDSTDKTFVIEVSSDYAESVIPYFEKIFSWLAKEIKFKSALKHVIQLQKEVRKSQQDAFEALYAA